MYRNGKSYNDYWTDYFKSILINHPLATRILSNDLKIDILSGNILNRLDKLIDNDDKLIRENILCSWYNLLNEWCNRSINKYLKTYLYISKIKYHPLYRKIGITYDIDNRQSISNGKYYDYNILHVYSNRYAAAYAEYKIRTKFCIRESEIIQCQDISSIKSIKIHEDKKELMILGWKYKNGI